MDFEEDKLTENLMALAATIEKSRPTGCKGKLWNTAAIASSLTVEPQVNSTSVKAVDDSTDTTLDNGGSSSGNSSGNRAGFSLSLSVCLVLSLSLLMM